MSRSLPPLHACAGRRERSARRREDSTSAGGQASGTGRRRARAHSRPRTDRAWTSSQSIVWPLRRTERCRTPPRPGCSSCRDAHVGTAIPRHAAPRVPRSRWGPRAAPPTPSRRDVRVQQRATEPAHPGAVQSVDRVSVALAPTLSLHIRLDLESAALQDADMDAPRAELAGEGDAGRPAPTTHTSVRTSSPSGSVTNLVRIDTVPTPHPRARMAGLTGRPRRT